MTTIHLYVKKHCTTGLKYFGKTTRKDPVKYLGSGSYWRRHLNKHGNNVETLNVWTFDSLEEATNFALKFSEDNNIVESESWANLIPEDASYGGLKGFKHSEESRSKMSKSSKGNQHRRGKQHSLDAKLKMSNSHKRKKLTETHKRNISLSKESYWTEERRLAHGLNQKGRASGSNNPQYGKIWMTNSIDNVIVTPDKVDEFIALGYRKGRIVISSTL